MDKKKIADILREFITTELLQKPDRAMADDEKLFSTGTINSFDIAIIGVFNEIEFDLYISDWDLSAENMDTVSLLADSIIAGLTTQEM